MNTTQFTKIAESNLKPGETYYLKTKWGEAYVKYLGGSLGQTPCCPKCGSDDLGFWPYVGQIACNKCEVQIGKIERPYVGLGMFRLSDLAQFFPASADAAPTSDSSLKEELEFVKECRENMAGEIERLQPLLNEARAQRDWLIEQCGKIGVRVNVVIGAPLTQAYQLVNEIATAPPVDVRELAKEIVRKFCFPTTDPDFPGTVAAEQVKAISEIINRALGQEPRA